MGRVGIEGLKSKDLPAALLHTSEALQLAQKQVMLSPKPKTQNSNS